MQRGRLRVGRRVEHRLAAVAQSQRGADRRGVEAAGRQLVELGIADEHRLLGGHDPGAEIAQHPVAIDERDVVVVLEPEREAGRLIEVVLAGDAVKEVDAVRAAAEAGRGPRIGVDVEIEPAPFHLRVGEEPAARHQRRDAIGGLAGVADVHVGFGGQRLGNRPEDGVIHRRAQFDEHVAAARQLPDGMVEPVHDRRDAAQQRHRDSIQRWRTMPAKNQTQSS